MTLTSLAKLHRNAILTSRERLSALLHAAAHFRSGFSLCIFPVMPPRHYLIITLHRRNSSIDGKNLSSLSQTKSPPPYSRSFPRHGTRCRSASPGEPPSKAPETCSVPGIPVVPPSKTESIENTYRTAIWQTARPAGTAENQRRRQKLTEITSYDAGQGIEHPSIFKNSLQPFRLQAIYHKPIKTILFRFRHDKGQYHIQIAQL